MIRNGFLFATVVLLLALAGPSRAALQGGHPPSPDIQAALQGGHPPSPDMTLALQGGHPPSPDASIQ